MRFQISTVLECRLPAAFEGRRSVMYYHQRTDGVTITIKVTPNASGNSVSSGRGDELEVRLTSPPVEGRANKALLKFLGKLLGVPPSSLTIVHGHGSRRKIVLVPGLGLDDIRDKLEVV
jgi:uncharacterized protein